MAFYFFFLFLYALSPLSNEDFQEKRKEKSTIECIVDIRAITILVKTRPSIRYDINIWYATGLKLLQVI